MKPIHLHSIHLPRVTLPRWGWRLFVVAVAVLGCLPAVIVRFQILATLDEFDANRLPKVRHGHEKYADVAQRSQDETGRAPEFEAGVLR